MEAFLLKESKGVQAHTESPITITCCYACVQAGGTAQQNTMANRGERVYILKGTKDGVVGGDFSSYEGSRDSQRYGLV